MQQITYHPEYSLMQDKVAETRIALAGEFFVKRERESLLPHPSTVDQKSTDAKVRYDIYISNAEYDNYPSQTLESLVGKMRFGAAEVVTPDRMNYIVESADGDGMSLRGMMEQTAQEVLAVKWQCLVVDYQGLSDVDIEQLSLADVRQLNPRSTIKAYSRENVINWHFERINGTMQLVYVMLREIGSSFNPSNAVRNAVESYLILALDENGNYYQQKIVKGAENSLVMGDMSFVSVGGSAMNWLPVLFASDKELPAGKLPKELGYLSPICDLALARYRMSAEYKETIRNLPPTTYVFGAKSNYMEMFHAANQRDYVMTGSGAVNVMPEGCTVDVVGVNAVVEPYESYFDRNTAQARQLGAAIPDDSNAATATEVNVDSAEQSARLVTLAESIESVYTRLCLYAGMFEGLWAADAIEQNAEQVQINLPKDFSKAKMTADEVRVLLELVLGGLMTREQAIRKLSDGGWTMEDAETMLDEMDSGSNLTPEL